MSKLPPGGQASRLDDKERLAEIAALGLLDADVEQVLADIAEEAAARLDLPISLVSVVLDEAQHFAAAHGLSGWLAQTRGTPMEWSFCAHAVRSGEPFIVEDATTHPALEGNRLVSHDGLRCYAGVPLITSKGYPLGTLCVIGTEARSFSAEELAVLRYLADEAVRRIEARRQTDNPPASAAE